MDGCPLTVLMLLAMDLMELQDIEILTRDVKGC
jgi:hypothetical protein